MRWPAPKRWAAPCEIGVPTCCKPLAACHARPQHGLRARSGPPAVGRDRRQRRPPPLCALAGGTGDFLFRAGRLAEARSEFQAAATLTRNERERAFLLARADACDGRRVCPSRLGIRGQSRPSSSAAGDGSPRTEPSAKRAPLGPRPHQDSGAEGPALNAYRQSAGRPAATKQTGPSGAYIGSQQCH